MRRDESGVLKVTLGYCDMQVRPFYFSSGTGVRHSEPCRYWCCTGLSLASSTGGEFHVAIIQRRVNI